MPPELKPDRLLAKSVEGPWKGSYSLVGHTADVVGTVTTLVNVLGDRILKQFNLDCTLEHLKQTVRLAAYIHDWGKANDHFQGVVRQKMAGAYPRRNPMQTPQLLRHEALSVLMAWEFRDWFNDGKNGDFMLALAAAGGHHLKLGGKAGQRTDNVGELRQGGGDRIELYTSNHTDFIDLLKYGREALDLPSLSITPSQAWDIPEIKRRQRLVRDAFNSWQGDSVLLAVLKALLICGDSIGSAAPSVSVSISQWIQDEVSRTLDLAKAQCIIDARLPEGKALFPFQEAVAASQARVTLVRAGCGTGKTLGAYAWARHQANGRKLFFCYPTTGTSTEGFIDYVHGQADAALLHSRAEIDLERWRKEQKNREIRDIYSTGEEEDAGDDSDNEVAKKLESFRAWGREVNVCTVDTVLGMLQCNRRALHCFPVIANAAFVFDEVHCYDDKLFGALLRFLEMVRAPMLLMSASFLPWQKEAIQQAVDERIEVVPGPPEIESQARYRFHNRDTPNWQRVEAELQAGGKVLWVCNRVNEAISTYQEAKARGINAVLYHSRFRYEDRVNHHRAVVDGFKPNTFKMKMFLHLVPQLSISTAASLERFATVIHSCFSPLLAVTTQVAEMSLDLSATLLVTQIADPAGLIQRLGRLNRRYCGHALDAIFYPDAKPGYPYPQDKLDKGLALVQNFTGDREVNQTELAVWLENLGEISDPCCDSLLLDGRWRTYPVSLRSAGHNVTAVLEDDWETVKALPNKELPKYTVPLPNQNLAKWQKDKHKFYPVASSDWWGYSQEVGAYEISKQLIKDR